MSDDTSMDEAMAAARSETDREVTTQQLDAFHKTFNFCMTCRQYTCGNCWNEAEGRCLTCAPHLGHEILPAPFPDLPADGTSRPGRPSPQRRRNGHARSTPVEALAWPTMDLEREPTTDADDRRRREPASSRSTPSPGSPPSAPVAAVDEAREDELAPARPGRRAEPAEAVGAAEHRARGRRRGRSPSRWPRPRPGRGRGGRRARGRARPTPSRHRAAAHRRRAADAEPATAPRLRPRPRPTS